MKYWIIAAFVGIFLSLAGALVFMMRGQTDEKSKKTKMAWALAARVGVSIVLFLSILLAWKLGYIQPSGISVGQ